MKARPLPCVGNRRRRKTDLSVSRSLLTQCTYRRSHTPLGIRSGGKNCLLGRSVEQAEEHPSLFFFVLPWPEQEKILLFWKCTPKLTAYSVNGARRRGENCTACVRLWRIIQFLSSSPDLPFLSAEALMPTRSCIKQGLSQRYFANISTCGKSPSPFAPFRTLVV